MTLARWLVVAATAAVLATLAAVLFFAHPRESVYVLVGDDAGYYFTIARNWVLGYGPSFDRLQPTNGFNPLLTVLLAAVYRLLGGEPSVLACYRAGILVTFVAMLAGMAGYARLLRPFLDALPAGPASRALLGAAYLAFYACFLAPKSYYGMDAFLVLALGSWYLARVARVGLLAPGATAALLDGGLLGLVFLARVDSLPLVVAAYLWMLLAIARRAGRPRDLALRLVVTAVLVLPFLAISVVEFGTWVPVSARLKSAFPQLDLGRSLQTIRSSSLNLADQFAFLLAFLVAATLAVRWAWRLVWEGAASSSNGAGAHGEAVLATFTTYLLLRFGYMGLFSRMDVQGSYAILAHVYLVLVLVLGLGRVARAIERPDRIVVAAAGALVLLSGLLLAGKLSTMRAWREHMTPGGAGDETAFAAAIRRQVGPGDVLYGGAFGLLGYFTDRAWVNGDGVANSYDYQAALRDGRLAQYLRARRVSHVVQLCPPAAVAGDSLSSILVHSPLYDRGAAYEVRSDDVVLRWRTLRGGGAEVCVARYRE
jgi:hypothetical protein